ncbi:hypothetical protein DYI24_23985 [Rhodopseudomonas sp. BR0C11]|uniref:hypothetical protein n=1 Tax=Rhodopseudomonas sp. BR0C11 TaxID=2269370 RepID=UPI0013E064C8|nr:hypothetical protein [Rhodopseudomonas sp. BR0C11]NEV80100.1 hypothetical protein [Rhodopseudomonas sp. BR0C11]
MSCPPQPALVFVPAACPRCGARNTDEADSLCDPQQDSSGEWSCAATFGRDNQVIAPTAESIAAIDAWIDMHADCGDGLCCAAPAGEVAS